MSKPLRALVVEDSIEDTELSVAALRDGGYDITFERVETADTMTSALDRERWDVVLSDYQMPRFNGVTALKLLRDKGLDIPFIFVSGRIGEDTAVAAMKAGANDYVLKGNMKRLLPAVERELRESEIRRERQRVQEQLRQSEERFRQLAENIREVFFLTNADATSMIYVSPAYENVWGRSCQRLYADPFSWLEGVYPEDHPRVEDLLREGPERFQAEFRVIRPDGALRWIWARTFPIKDEKGMIYRLAGIAEDITERKRAEEALAAEKERLAVTLGSIGDGVIATDVTGRVIFMNRTAEELCGWLQEEVIGRPLPEIFHIVHEKSRADCENPVEKVLATGKIVAHASHTVLLSRDGRERAIVDSVAPIRNREGRMIGVVLVFRDVTEKQRMQEELLRASTLESVGLLAGGIAHDFNNILTAILGNLSLAMLSLDKRSEAYKRLAQAEKASMRARNLAQQLLTFAKGGAGQKNRVIGRSSPRFGEFRGEGL